MNDEELIAYYKEGLIPSEEEDQETFKKRAEFCRGIKKRLQETMVENTPPFIDAENLLEDVHNQFGIKPLWVPVFCSNEKLLPWQGASCWIFELEEKDPLSALIQLRGRHVALLGSREEAVTHESVHIARMAFEEPVYEEVIAYSVSKIAFRRFMGPLFRSNAESITFAALLISIVVFDFLLLLSGSIKWYDRFMWLKLIPFSYFLFLFLRLYKSQARFKKVQTKLKLPQILMLTDQEIDRFSGMEAREVADEILKGKQLSLRRRLLALTGLGNGI